MRFGPTYTPGDKDKDGEHEQGILSPSNKKIAASIFTDGELSKRQSHSVSTPEPTLSTQDTTESPYATNQDAEVCNQAIAPNELHSSAQPEEQVNDESWIVGIFWPEG